MAEQTDELWFYKFGSRNDCKTIADISSNLEQLAEAIQTSADLETIYGLSATIRELCEDPGKGFERNLEDLFMPEGIMEYNPGMYDALKDKSFTFQSGLVSYVRNQCQFPSEVAVAESEMLDVRKLESARNLEMILSSEIPEGTDERILALVPYVKAVFPDMDTLLDQYLGTIPLDALDTTYWQMSAALSDDPELSGAVGEMVSPDDAEVLFSTRYTELKQFDDTITSLVELHGSGPGIPDGLMTFERFDDLAVGNAKPRPGHVIVVDITRQKYQKDDLGSEYMGILPVFTTAANALYYQKYLVSGSGTSDRYTILGSLRNVSTPAARDAKLVMEGITHASGEKDFGIVGLERYLGNEPGSEESDYTVSYQASEQFPQVQFQGGHVKPGLLKQVGLVVFQMFKDVQDGGKTDFVPVEAFVGSFDRNATDEITHASTFLDNIVNQQSRYVNIFSNLKFAQGGESLTDYDRASIFGISRQAGCSLGFYSVDTRKTIRVGTSITKAMDRVFRNVTDPNKVDIDIVCDAGVSNIAQYIASTGDGPEGDSSPDARIGYYDLDSDRASLFRIDRPSDVSTWAKIARKFDDFAKNVRRDCIYLADGPRQLVLDGQLKKLRKTRPTNTFVHTMVPRLRLISNVVNSSYSAGYLNWFQVQDTFSGRYFWCPPSIKAMGICMLTDRYSNFWEAPAGMNRGVVLGALDVSFNPTVEEAGYLYQNSWNYAVSYPAEGIVLEGQRTFQTNRTALDRINVRRLLLGLEKTTRRYAKYFNYEGNTAWLRQRFTDGLNRYFEEVQAGGGLNQFLIVCDDRNNTP